MSNSVDNDIVEGEFDSVEFASYLYQEARTRRLVINATKLQKWLYICYGVYLAGTAGRLLKERPKAWPYGPVFPKLHRFYTKNDLDQLGQKVAPHVSEIHESAVDATLRVFGGWSAGQLSEWTHRKGRAWDKTRQISEKYNTPIDDGFIIDDFKKILKRS